MNILKNILIDYIGWRCDNFSWRRWTKIPVIPTNPGVLLLHLDDKLGDALMISSIISPILEKYPDARLSVVTSKLFLDYWASNQNIENVIAIPTLENKSTVYRLFKTIYLSKIFYQKTDVLISFDNFAALNSFLIIKVVKPKLTIGFEKQIYRLFDISIHDNSYALEKEHTSEKIRKLLHILGININSQIAPHIYITDTSENECNNIIVDNVSIKILFNTYAASPLRSFNYEYIITIVQQIIELTAKKNINLYLNVSKEYTDLIVNELNAQLNDNKVIILPTNMKLDTLFSVVSKMNYVITPDTGIVHIAAAMNIPQTVVYADVDYNPIVWAPLSDIANLVTPTNNDVEINQVKLGLILHGLKEFLSRN